MLHAGPTGGPQATVIIEQITAAKSETFLRQLLRAEQVQPFTGLDDLMTRMTHPERRIYAIRSPYDEHRADATVQVALTSGLPHDIQQIVQATNQTQGPLDTAVFYSISNWPECRPRQGRPLIYGAAQAISETHPDIKFFATLSPFSKKRGQTLRDRVKSMGEDDFEKSRKPYVSLSYQDTKNKILDATTLKDIQARPEIFDWLQRFAITQTMQGKNGDGVGHFHTSNGAMVGRLCINGDKSERGFVDAFGFTVNYIYPVDSTRNNPLWRIEENREGAKQGIIARTRGVQALIDGEWTNTPRNNHFWHSHQSRPVHPTRRQDADLSDDMSPALA